MAAVSAVLFFQMDRSPVLQKSDAQRRETASNSAKTTARPKFDDLAPELQQAVRTKHELAFNYFKAKDYQAAMREIQELLAMCEDYKDSRDIFKYAKIGELKSAEYSRLHKD